MSLRLSHLLFCGLWVWPFVVPSLVIGWGGDEHAAITAEAVKLLPSASAAILAPEAAVLARQYCEFPDENWPAYGEWGGGNADPRLPRFPDTRREWDISFYCGWNPVSREGKSYPHRAPESLEAVPLYFMKAVEALKAGRLEDGARFLGVALHYIEDSASFGHLQAIHRNLHWDKSKPFDAGNHTPRALGDTPENAAEALRTRLRGMVAFTEAAMDPMLAKVGMPLREVKRLSETEVYPKEAVRAVLTAKFQFVAEWEAGTRECALAAARVCADALHSALSFAADPFPETTPNFAGVNLAFNPSFEQAGDDIAEGWCIGWHDLSDHTGRAEWYRAGTHWDKPVKSGQRSALVLWPPQKGIEWRQTWRHAIRVNPGEIYRAKAWVKSRANHGGCRLVLEFSDTAYLPLAESPASPAHEGDSDWKQIMLESSAPEKARWLRLILRSNAEGAVWFDDVSIERIVRP